MRRLLLLSAVLPLLGLSACNRGSTDVVPGSTVALKLTDYRIAPQRVRVKPGRITFTVRNTSRLPHNWLVAGRGRVRARIKTMLPGESGTVTVRLGHGTYRMYCSQAHDEQLGEYGTVSVR